VNREKHIASCKRRALKDLDAGDLVKTVVSMISNMQILSVSEVDADQMLIGWKAAVEGDTHTVRRWIEGFR
jgi:hypothetical protein